jgi:hypothetical protein
MVIMHLETIISLYRLYRIAFCYLLSVQLDWIGLAEERYRWRALVNSVMKLRVP